MRERISRIERCRNFLCTRSATSSQIAVVPDRAGMLTRDELNRLYRWLKLNAEALETAERARATGTTGGGDVLGIEAVGVGAHQVDRRGGGSWVSVNGVARCAAR